MIELAAKSGLVLDVTFNQDTPSKTFAEHEAGIVATTKALAGRGNVLFDLQNEANHSANLPLLFMSAAQALTTRNAVKAADPLRLLTVSVTSTTALASYTGTAKLDVAGYHCCRNTGSVTDWAAETLQAAKAARNAVGPGIPIYFQEPNRCGSGKQYATCNGDGSEFVTAAVNAKQGGAAGWVFHSMASYDLTLGTLQSQLNATEMDALHPARAGGRESDVGALAQRESAGFSQRNSRAS